MDKEELQKNIALYYSRLQPKAQEFFSKMEWLVALGKMSEKYSLNDSEKETLGTETTLLLLGAIHPVEYEEVLVKELSLSPQTLENLMKEIENSMLADVRQQLIEAYNSNRKFETGPAEEDKEVNISVKPDSAITQNLDSRFDKLPENIQEVVEKSNYQNTLYEIARARKLSITQMGILDTVTTDLMVGAIHSDQYRGVLLKKLGLSESDTTSLVNEINEKVFKTIRGGMMKMSEVKTQKTEAVPMPKPDIRPLESDLDTLKAHGIEIVPDLPAVHEAQLPQAGKLEIEAPHPILAQKMSTVVQTPTIKNQYELKSSPEKTTEVKNTAPVAPKTTSYPKGADPYRAIPE